jgi:hypothetical protein
VLWRFGRAGYPIVPFIRDEIVVEIFDGPDADRDALEIRRLMVAGVREVMSDIRVDVEYIVSRSWDVGAALEAGEHEAYTSEAIPSSMVTGSPGRRRPIPRPGPIGSIHLDQPFEGALHVLTRRAPHRSIKSPIA